MLAKALRHRRLVAALGVVLAGSAAVIAAVALAGRSQSAILPSELRVLDAEAAQPRPETAFASLARSGLNALLVDVPSARLTAAAKRSKLLVLTPLRTRNAAAAVGACRGVHGLCTVEVPSIRVALAAAAADGVDLVVVRLHEPAQLRRLVETAERGRILAVVDEAWPDAVGLAAASPVVDLAAPSTTFARLRPAAAGARPLPPRALHVTATAWRAVTLTWRAPEQRVVAYRVSRDGTPAWVATSTFVPLTGLACGTRYTFGVQAVDARGRASVPAHVSTSTRACPLLVSIRGSDSNNCSQKSPCLTFNRAYHVAEPGQVVEVANGGYLEQTLLYDPKKAGAKRPHVVFQPAPGAKVKIWGDINIADVRSVKGASHVTLRNMTINSTVNLEGCGVPDGQQCPPDATAGTNDLTFENLRVKGGVAFLCHSCSNVQILGGVWGPDSYLPSHGSLHPEVSPAYDAINFVKLKRPNHILIDGARFQNFARSTSSDHTECLQFEPADYVTIRNSVFTHCDTITLAFFTSLAGDSLSPAGFKAPDHIVLENNFIDHSYDRTGGPTYNGLQIGECTNCVIRNNSWLQNAHLPCNAPCGEISRNNLVVGNVGPQSDCGNGGIVFSHNVFQGVACGPTDKNVARLGFVNPARMNLHLLASSPAVNAGDPRDFPRRDIDGQRRPIGRADAGADERR